MESLVPVESLPLCIGHQGLIYFSSGKNKLSLREREGERERERERERATGCYFGHALRDRL